MRWGSHAYYEPFGRYRMAPTKDITDRAFTGQRENMDWGLYYYNARYYVPGLGRFASADTIVPEPANPQSFNRYSYVNNNPVRYTDPTGHYLDKDGGGGGGPPCYTGPMGATCGTGYMGSVGVASGAATGPGMQALVANVGEVGAGILWELADWAIALRDGVQWYDTLGMLPIIPAAFGDDLGQAAARLIPAGWSDEASRVVGHWDDMTAAWVDKDWSAYQAHVTGVEGMEFKFNGVRFDGIIGSLDANDQIDNLILLDAKYWRSDSHVRHLDQQWAQDAILGQAERQLGAVQGTGIPIQWHVSDARAAEILERFFRREGINIDVVHTAWSP